MRHLPVQFSQLHQTSERSLSVAPPLKQNTATHATYGGLHVLLIALDVITMCWFSTIIGLLFSRFRTARVTHSFPPPLTHSPKTTTQNALFTMKPLARELYRAAKLQVLFTVPGLSFNSWAAVRSLDNMDVC